MLCIIHSETKCHQSCCFPHTCSLFFNSEFLHSFDHLVLFSSIFMYSSLLSVSPGFLKDVFIYFLLECIFTL